MKDLVYSTPVNSEEDLVARVVAAAGFIQDDVVFDNIRESMIKKCRFCNQVGGRHFEQLL